MYSLKRGVFPVLLGLLFLTFNPPAHGKNASKVSRMNELLASIKEGDPGEVEMLVAAHPELLGQSCDSLGRKPLHVAARLNDRKTVEVLLSWGADFYAQDANGQLALDVQPGGEMNDTLRYLRGINDGRNKFLSHVTAGNFAEVKAALEADKSLAKSVDIGSGSSALLLACFKGQAKIAALLLESGAEVGHLEWSTQTDSMHWSVDANHADCVALLLDKGADIERKWPVNYGSLPMKMSALHVACWKGRPEIVKLLLERGADPNVRASSYAMFSPLHFAATEGHVEIMRYLLDHGADTEALDGRRGINAQQMAERGKHEAAAQLLRDYKPAVKN